MHGQDWLWYLESSAEDILKTTAKYFFCVLQRKKCKYVSIQKKDIGWQCGARAAHQPRQDILFRLFLSPKHFT